jgi:glycosyltransferase involved in cell wall biosynthesis
MKIIQLIQKPQLRGAEIFACQLSRELNSQGHQSIIVTIFDGIDLLPFDGRILTLNGSVKNRLWDIAAWKKLARIISVEQPDLIQANSGDTLKYAVFSKLLFRWKTPVIFRNASTISLYIKNSISKVWNSFLLKFTSHVISVSEFSKRDFINLFPSVVQKINVVPIGIIIPHSIEKEVGSFGEPFFLHIGGFSFEKNHRGLIQIFQQLKLKLPGAKLGLIGDGLLKPEIESAVAEGNLQDSIIFFGYHLNPLKFLPHAHCFLLPSIIEGMPAVILESFVCRVPVVAYDVGGVPEIVIPGATGWLVKNGDQKGFVEAVLEVLENKQKVSQYSRNAFELVNENFNIQVITKKFLTVYSKISQKQ